VTVFINQSTLSDGHLGSFPSFLEIQFHTYMNVSYDNSDNDLANITKQ